MKVLSAYLFISFFSLYKCSFGDRDYNFIICSKELFDQQCSKSNHKDTTLSLLKSNLFYWSCAEACEYECMSLITADRINRNLNIHKYYGHWPFIRYFGLEEPASVIFSILNGIPHFIYSLNYISQLRKFNYALQNSSTALQKRGEFFMSKWVFLYAVSAIMAWSMSAIYHSKKTDISTKYDLVFALGVLVAGLVLVIRKILGRTNIFVVVSFVCMSGCLYLARAISILDGVVSFDSHMNSCIVLFSITSVLWAYWACLGHRKSLLLSSPSFEWPSLRSPRWLCLLCNVWLLLAALLELFDFPPIFGIFDAHSLWHAATAPLGIVWYRFWEIVEDEELLMEEKTEDQFDDKVKSS